MAGVCAALAAARNGARVILLEGRSVLGGNASSQIRMHIVGASCSGCRPGARESGIIEELRLEDAARNPQRSPALFDLLLYDAVRRETNITLLLDTYCVGCRTEGPPSGRLIRSVQAVRSMSEEEFLIEAPLFADCTGDGRLGMEAGAEFRMGREARSEYGESLAPERADACTMGSTILFMARRHDRPMPFTPPPWARRFSEEDLRLRSHREYEYGYWWVEWGGELDTIKDGDRIRHELLAIALGVWDHIKNGCTGGGAATAGEQWRGEGPPPWESAENWALEWIGMLPGKRESRRFLGPHVLSERDLMQGRIFEDDVAYGGWWIDLHPPRGIEAVWEFPCRQVELPHLYGIPLRSLYSRNVENLFFAGRNISATHVALGSARVMGTCSVMGQAVGTAAAVAAGKGIGRIQELQAPELRREIQQALLRQDGFLLGVRNEDERDLARSARVAASSERPGSPAAAVLNGITRATHRGLHPALPEGTNQWASEGLPAWIELEWAAPRRFSEVRLTFDSGFQRELALTMSEAYRRKMLWGPQPETVRDYRLVWDGGAVEVRGNYQRLRAHRLAEPAASRRLRLEVSGTHGEPCARVFEIRVYP